MNKQRGFIPLIVLAGMLVFGGAVVGSAYNATQHPEVSKAGRS